MTLQRLQPGEEFTPQADTWNAFADAAELVLGRREQAETAGVPPHDPTRRGMMLVKNTTATAWGRFQPVGVAGTLWSVSHSDGGPDVPATIDGVASSTKIGDISGRQVLLGEALDADKHQGRWCVTLEPIAAGGFGWACVQGLCLCRVTTYLSGYELQPLGQTLRYAALRRVGSESVITLATTGDAAVIFQTQGPGALGAAYSSIALIDLGARRETAIVQLTAPIQFPDEQNDADAPFSANALLLVREPVNGGYSPINTATQQVTVWFPAWRRVSGEYVGLPPARAGDRVPVYFNAQSARWESLLTPPQWCRFEMRAALSCGGSAQARTIVWDHNNTEHRGTPPGETITVYDAQSLFSKPATTGDNPGALGIAVFAADRNRWEIVSMQTPGDFIGALAQDCHRWDSTASVNKVVMLGGYDVFGSSTSPITVANPVGGGNQTIGPPSYTAARWFSGRQGDRVLCRWDIRGGQYMLAAAEPNDLDWQDLDVVTRTTLSINFSAQTFEHRYYTRSIRVPPMVTIGSEVQH